jgi:hypothetical protein
VGDEAGHRDSYDLGSALLSFKPRYQLKEMLRDGLLQHLAIDAHEVLRGCYPGVAPHIAPMTTAAMRAKDPAIAALSQWQQR